MLKKSDFEMIEIPGAEIISNIQEPEEWLESGSYPFILGTKNSADILTNHHLYENVSAKEIIKEALQIDVLRVFEVLKKSNLPSAPEYEFDITDFTGIWTEQTNPYELGLRYADFITAHRDLSTGKLYAKCLLGTAPTTTSWQVPAFVRIGGWNTCPPPPRHCAILRYWQEKYGAELVSLTNEIIECRVENPPQTEAECFELAWQQFAYCPDNVFQGAETIGALASKLRAADYWYFWWD